MLYRVIISTFIFFSSAAGAISAPQIDPQKLIKEAVNYWRGSTSYAEASMTVHRPDWERQFAFKGWTKGEDNSLVRFTEPPKDSGNATLVHDREMWSYSPKINRTIKIPPSMMSQSWMGSDFSHSDLSKQKDIIDRYDHTLIKSEEKDGHYFYTIQSIPKEEAAVVWGKEVLVIRDDLVIMERSFFDQEMKLVKSLHASDLQRSGTKTYARTTRMQNVEKPGEWTEVVYKTLQFDVPVEDSLFSLSSLERR